MTPTARLCLTDEGQPSAALRLRPAAVLRRRCAEAVLLGVWWCWRMVVLGHVWCWAYGGVGMVVLLVLVEGLSPWTPAVDAPYHPSHVNATTHRCHETRLVPT